MNWFNNRRSGKIIPVEPLNKLDDFSWETTLRNQRRFNSTQKSELEEQFQLYLEETGGFRGDMRKIRDRNKRPDIDQISENLGLAWKDVERYRVRNWFDNRMAIYRKKGETPEFIVEISSESSLNYI